MLSFRNKNDEEQAWFQAKRCGNANISEVNTILHTSNRFEALQEAIQANQIIGNAQESQEQSFLHGKTQNRPAVTVVGPNRLEYKKTQARSSLGTARALVLVLSVMLVACLMGSTNRAVILPREEIAPHRKGGTCIARLPLENGGVGIAITPSFEACNAQGASRGKGNTQPSPWENPHRLHMQPSEDGNPSMRRGRVVHIHDEGVQCRHAEDVEVIKSKHRDSIGSYDTMTNKQNETTTIEKRTCEGKG